MVQLTRNKIQLLHTNIPQQEMYKFMQIYINPKHQIWASLLYEQLQHQY